MVTTTDHATGSAFHRLYRVVRPLLFRLDAEQAHNLVFTGLALAESLARRLNPAPGLEPTLAQRIWGLRFAQPIGLAAGLDKNAAAPHVWPLLGFGFAELGTITQHAQPGNPRPRLFRLPADRALINRLGFNNHGAAAVATRLERLWHAGPPAIPIGINLGKSKITPLGDAAGDYVHSLRTLWRFASYVVINVSSPNTPGLRDLQAEEELARLLDAVLAENHSLAAHHGRPAPPILIKIAPDLADEALPGIVAVARRGAAGLIATNTTIRRENLHTPIDEAGGLSGAPLRRRSTEVIRRLYQLTAGSLPIIGVGGVFDAADAYEKIRAGARLVQVYTGLIYEGPTLPRDIANGLVSLLRRDGIAHIQDAVGRDAGV